MKGITGHVYTFWLHKIKKNKYQWLFDIMGGGLCGYAWWNAIGKEFF